MCNLKIPWTLLEDHYYGSASLLTEHEQRELAQHLEDHRLGFAYKKTKQVPGKVGPTKQEEFTKEYALLKQKMKPEDKIYFIDATHPQHNNMPFYGWIYKGDIKTLKANSGRKILNLNGALDIEPLDITVLSEKTINTDAMKRLIRDLNRAIKCAPKAFR